MQAIQAALINARAALGVNPTQSGNPQSASSQYTAAGQPEQRTDYERQNDQEQKTTFGQQNGRQESEYLASTRKPAQSRYEIKAGWLVPAVLEQQLNSDLPGFIRALVRENVYDSATGRYILIPSGSTLIGVYNSHVGYGQNALQAVWRRVVFPDGSSLALGGFEGDDSAGTAGFRDQVNNHWGRILSGALLTSLFAAGIEVSQGTNSSVLQSPSVGQTVGQAVGQQGIRGVVLGDDRGRPAHERGLQLLAQTHHAARDRPVPHRRLGVLLVHDGEERIHRVELARTAEVVPELGDLAG